MLLILCACILAGWVAATLAPDTMIGRACRNWLIERPAAWMASLTPRKAVWLVISGAVMAVAVAYLAPIISGETALLLASDALSYVEVLTAVVIVAVRSGRTSTAVRHKLQAVGSRVFTTCRALTRSRALRSLPRPSRLLPPADDPDPAFALA